MPSHAHEGIVLTRHSVKCLPLQFHLFLGDNIEYQRSFLHTSSFSNRVYSERISRKNLKLKLT